MKHLIALITLVGLTFAGNAMGQEYLTPCDSSLRAYTDRVDTIAHRAMPGKLKLSVTVIPSFTPEWSIGITSDKDVLYLTYVVFDQSLWDSSWVPARRSHKNDPSAGHATPEATTVRITQNLYAALLSEWQKSIGRARPSRLLGLDGVTYRFELPTNQCASTWSPAPKTRDRKLVNIVQELRELASGREKLAPVKSAAIIKALQELPQP